MTSPLGNLSDADCVSLLDASFLLAVEFFCLQFDILTYGGGPVRKKKPKSNSGRAGGTVSKKTKLIFH